MRKTGVTLGWGYGGLNSARPLFSLCQRDLNLFVSSGDERGEWKQLAKLKETQENRESERNKTHKKKGKTVKQIRETGGWPREKQTCKERICTRIEHFFPGKVVRFSSSTVHTEPASLATHWTTAALHLVAQKGPDGSPVIAFTLRAWQLVTRSLCDDTGQWRGCLREASNRTFHHVVPEMTPTERTVDALISPPRC